jgi:hypothetical protein
MGAPLATPQIPVAFALGSTSFVDVFDLTAPIYAGRSFIGMSVHNPSSGSRIVIGFGKAFNTDQDLVIRPNSTFVLDAMNFGPVTNDQSKGENTTHIRAALDVAQGTPASATIGYGGSGNPTDGMLVNINGKIYEFSDDNSKNPANDVKVDIAASADLTWQNFVNEVLANEQALLPTIDTGADTVTVTSRYGGAFGDGLVVADGATPTGAAFSGNTSGGSGGVPAIINIW